MKKDPIHKQIMKTKDAFANDDNIDPEEALEAARGGSRLVQTMLMHQSENCESWNINMSISIPIAKTTKGYIQTLYHSLQKYHVMNKRSCWAKIRSKKYITAAKLW